MIMDAETEEKIIALVIKLAYMEDFVSQLQEVSVEHTQTIEVLRKENQLLAQKVRDLSELVEGDVPNRRPPHY